MNDKRRKIRRTSKPIRALLAALEARPWLDSHERNELLAIMAETPEPSYELYKQMLQDRLRALPSPDEAPVKRPRFSLARLERKAALMAWRARAWRDGWRPKG